MSGLLKTFFSVVIHLATSLTGSYVVEGDGANSPICPNGMQPFLQETAAEIEQSRTYPNPFDDPDAADRLIESRSVKREYIAYGCHRSKVQLHAWLNVRKRPEFKGVEYDEVGPWNDVAWDYNSKTYDDFERLSFNGKKLGAYSIELGDFSWRCLEGTVPAFILPFGSEWVVEDATIVDILDAKTGVLMVGCYTDGMPLNPIRLQHQGRVSVASYPKLVSSGPSRLFQDVLALEDNSK